jgi:hypothetical protein
MLNPKALELFGYSDYELVDQNIEILIPKRLTKTHVHDRTVLFLGPRARGGGQ